jgi:hypothetical protein
MFYFSSISGMIAEVSSILAEMEMAPPISDREMSPLAPWSFPIIELSHDVRRRLRFVIHFQALCASSCTCEGKAITVVMMVSVD